MMTARMHLLSVFALKLFSCRSFSGECNYKNKCQIVIIEGLSGASKGVKMIFDVSERLVVRSHHSCICSAQRIFRFQVKL